MCREGLDEGCSNHDEVSAIQELAAVEMAKPYRGIGQAAAVSRMEVYGQCLSRAGPPSRGVRGVISFSLWLMLPMAIRPDVVS